MKINKVELKERQFTPYNMVITIESEKEHNDLSKEVCDIQNSAGMFYRLRDIVGYGSALGQLLDIIKNHTK